MYAIPYEYYEKYGVRRYGFHGTSHKYVSHRAAEFLEEPIERLKLITWPSGQWFLHRRCRSGQSH